jgi:hypothetical protein
MTGEGGAPATRRLISERLRGRLCVFVCIKAGTPIFKATGGAGVAYEASLIQRSCPSFPTTLIFP